jgi:hypothetical protein
VDDPNVGAISPGGVNKPDSGTYGEGAALQRLKDSLPPPPTTAPGQPMAPPPVSPQPARATPQNLGGRPVTGAAAPPGIPSALLAPTQQPGTPVATPLSSPVPNPVLNAVNAQQQRLALLDQLASNPQVSDDTREWAQQVIRLLTSTTRS